MQYGLPWEGGLTWAGIVRRGLPEEVMDAELSHEGLSGCLPGKGEEVQAKGAVWVHRGEGV